MGNQVLVLDTFDPPDAALRSHLAESGLTVQTTADIDSAARWLRIHAPACILTWVRDASDADLCRSLRTLSDAPIIAISTERDENLTVRCLEAGADRVLLAPISRRELAARMGALLARRNGSAAAEWLSQVHVGDLVIDAQAHSVTNGGLPLALTPTEFRLLVALARRADEVVSYRQLLAEVWGAASVESMESLRLYIHYLRQKLGDDQAQPRLLLNQRGVGYRLVQDATATDGKGSAHGQHESGRRGDNARSRGPVRARLPLAASGS